MPQSFTDMRRHTAVATFAITFVLVMWLGQLFGPTLFDYTLPHDDLSKQAMPLDASNCTLSEDGIRLVKYADLSNFAHSLPPYLISFQGSGNTFTRLVLELITGFYTGSAMFNDRFLIRAGFEGDKYCSDQVIAVKSHV